MGYIMDKLLYNRLRFFSNPQAFIEMAQATTEARSWEVRISHTLKTSFPRSYVGCSPPVLCFGFFLFCFFLVFVSFPLLLPDLEFPSLRKLPRLHFCLV